MFWAYNSLLRDNKRREGTRVLQRGHAFRLIGIVRTFAPAIFSALRGYRRGDFFADLGAGLTVGLIALPLAIGFGIASGVTPQQGLWTGIIGNLVVAITVATGPQ